MLTLLLSATLLISACASSDHSRDHYLKKQLKLADSLYLAGNKTAGDRILGTIRPDLGNNPLICNYYYLLLQSNLHNPELMNLYADSALAFFHHNSIRVSKYPDAYFKALLMKGDASLKLKQYTAALSYYYQARKISAVGNCDDGHLATKMANIYFDQKNYKLAARYWAESYQLISACEVTYTHQKLFFVKQGSLDNTGLSYQRAGQIDSALYYYQQDLKLIDREDSLSAIDHSYIYNAKAVVLDNLGGLYLSLGKLTDAEQYLNRCMAVPLNETDGTRIPPLLKLIEIFLKQHEYAKAAEAFAKSKTLLNRYPKANEMYRITWDKLYAAFLFAQQKPADAYQYLNKYVALRDSIDRNFAGLYQLDVERELNTFHQQQTNTELLHQNQVKVTFLIGISVIVLLSLVITAMVRRNLVRSQRSQQNTVAQNLQLQHTLTELESVNKNYIRIMRIMAHDLRNPLSGMTGIATMLLEELDCSEENKQMLRLIENTGQHAMEMIGELLRSGLADENEPIETRTVDLKALLFDSVELLQFRAKEKKQQIVFEAGDEPMFAEINYEKMWRVFNNLIVNAVKFSHEDSVIKVAIIAESRNYLISIADNGVGIASEDKDVIFEMFTTAKRAGTSGEQPFGLGLSICKRIVEKHNGKIWFESDKDVGTTFYITLPRGAS